MSFRTMRKTKKTANTTAMAGLRPRNVGISENNKNLPKPDFYPEGHVETVEEFLARGGEITVLPRVKAPDEDPGDPPRRLLDTTGWYEV